MDNKTWIIIVVVILILAGGIWFFNSNKAKNETSMQENTTTDSMSQPSSNDSMTMDSSPEASTSGSDAMTDAKEIVVTGSSFKFAPNAITVKAGEPVKITFKNAGGMHDFVIDELNVKTKIIKDGESDTVTFTPDKAGTYEFYCGVGNHKAMGMKGVLTVE